MIDFYFDIGSVGLVFGFILCLLVALVGITINAIFKFFKSY